MLTYASETWTLTKRDRKQLNVFERKVYRRILGPLCDNEKENWSILTNKEIYACVKKPTIIETLRLSRLCWFGHVKRMEENRIPRRVLYMNLGTTRLRGRPRNFKARWGERGWKNSWWGRVAGKSTQQRGMEEAPEKGKESSNSAHANGMNEMNSPELHYYTRPSVFFFFATVRTVCHKNHFTEITK